MDARLVSYSELKWYFEKERLNKDLEDESNMGICSVADLLFITEDYKKKELKPLTDIESMFEKFQKGPEASGQIYIADIDREKLSEAMFEQMVGGVKLWETAASKEIPPRDSISYIALRPSSSTWWPEKVFEELCEQLGLNEE